MNERRKDYPNISELEEEIERVWTVKVKEDLENRKIMYYEDTLIASFYHHLRPFVDKYPGIRMFLKYKDPEYNYFYDLVIMKSQADSEWEYEEVWTRDIGRFWFVFEFKFLPKLKDEDAQKDIKKFQNLKRYDDDIKRVYFLSIDENTDFYRFINYKGSWFENYYREGRGIPSDSKKGEWDFEIILL